MHVHLYSKKKQGNIIVAVVWSSENKTLTSLGDNLKYNGWFSSSMFMVYRKVDQSGWHLVTWVRVIIPMPCFSWVTNLLCDCEWRNQILGVWEQSPKENIRPKRYEANWKGRELHNENLNYELITEVVLCWWCMHSCHNGHTLQSSRTRPRHVVTLGRLIIWRPLKPTFFKYSYLWFIPVMF
jgi:hypothetical protein